MKGVADIFTEPISKGVAHISIFDFNSKENMLYNLRAVRDGGDMFYIYDGRYIRLHVDGILMMSDTNLELSSNYGFVSKSNGDILIAGLGLGVIIRNILDKQNINSITVIEKYQDVIDLVAPKFNDNRIKYICDDIFTWRPHKGIKYDTIYFDIWPTINTDNLIEIKKLHNIFKYYVNRNNPNHYMNSWMKEFLQRMNRYN